MSYSDGIYDGTSYWYYPNGNLQEEITYSNGKVNGWYRSYYESGLLKEEKYVKDGVIEGIRKLYYANGALKAVMTYENGVVVKNVEFDYDPYYQAPINDYRAGNKQQLEQKNTDDFLCDAKICPQPLGGMESIYEKLIYPADAVAFGLEGDVKILAAIDRDGKVIETKIIRGIGLGCEEAAAEAVKKTRFLPGQNDSGPVTSNLTLTVKFTLKEGKPIVREKPSPKYETERVAEPEIGIASVPAKTTLEDVPEKKEVVEGTKPEQVTAEKTTLSSIAPADYFRCENVDVCARPQGGINAVLQNFKVPTRVREKNIQGEVIVLCKIDEYGNVRTTTVQQGLPEGASIAVEVAIIDTKFEPAIKDGEPVSSSVIVTVPVRY